MKKVPKIWIVFVLIFISGMGAGIAVQEVPFVYDWENRRTPVPERHVFQTDYLGGTQIVFDHQFHSDMLGLECIECHHVEGCNHCHRDEVTQVDVQESKVAIHTNCFACHEGMACVDCHKQ